MWMDRQTDRQKPIGFQFSGAFYLNFLWVLHNKALYDISLIQLETTSLAFPGLARDGPLRRRVFRQPFERTRPWEGLQGGRGEGPSTRCGTSRLLARRGGVRRERIGGRQPRHPRLGKKRTTHTHKHASAPVGYIYSLHGYDMQSCIMTISWGMYMSYVVDA